MTRRTWTLMVSLALVAVLGILGGFATVPYVALGPGRTYDTLGKTGDTPVIDITGEQTFPTAGQLIMTTVSVTDDVTLFGALGLWISGRYALAPREEFFPPDKTEQQVEQENTKAFQDSQSSAEIAALRHLKYPVKVLVGEIEKGSPSDGALEPGDRLLEVNGKKVVIAEDVRSALLGTTPGQQVSLRLQREGKPETAVQVVLAKRDDRQHGFLGVSAVERPDVPFQIKISLKDVGGPSAGLMFALSIVDKLTPGELSGGRFVAGTGEIDSDGNVVPIGGIPFKMVAAKEAGANVFLVPDANCSEAKQTAPEGLQLVKVAKLTDAVQGLEAIRDGKSALGC